MRAKFGIKAAENEGDIGQLRFTVRGASVRDRNVSDSEGINYARLFDLPKLDVAGSTPVARSKIYLDISRSLLQPPWVDFS
jgi:hypothetical protein